MSTEKDRFEPCCSACPAPARWSIAAAEDGDLNAPTVSAFACRRHLSSVLEDNPDAMEGMDQAVIIDLHYAPEPVSF